MRFTAAALKVGEKLSDLELFGLDGSALRTSQLFNGRPLVIVTGSLTCPMTSSSIPGLNELQREFGRQIDFVTLYVREAHPGGLLPQPDSLQRKREHAVQFRDVLLVEAPVVVDDLGGTLHHLLDNKPNTAFVFDASRQLVFRSLWASDEPGLREALASIQAGELPRKSERTRMFSPVLKALGSVSETMSRAGTRAHVDLLLAAPPMEIAGLLAGLLKPLPRKLRGAGLIAAAVIGVFGALALLQ